MVVTYIYKDRILANKNKKSSKAKSSSGKRKIKVKKRSIKRGDMVGGNKAQLKATALTLRKKGNGKVHNLVDKYQITKPLRDKIYADIQRIRQMWCQGSSDMQIRRDLNLSHQSWRARLNIMRTVPPDEGVLASYKRYTNQHERFTTRLESRLDKLTGLYEAANEEIELPVLRRGATADETYKRKRDPREARRIQVQLARVDEAMRDGEEKLLAIKTQLGIISPLKLGQEGDDMSKSLFRASNIKEIWRRRKEKEKEVEVEAKNLGETTKSKRR